MRTRSKFLRWLGLGMLIALALVLVLGIWIIPAVIVAEIRKYHDGYVTIAGWWIDGSSVGVIGLTLHEQDSPSSPAWATAERVTCDLSLGSLLRGRSFPSRIVFRYPSISYRIDARGNTLTTIPLRHSGTGAVPELIARDGRLAIRQAGRPEMLIAHLDARVVPGPVGPRFEAQAADPRWGNPNLDGHFTPDFSAVALRLSADRLIADPDTWVRIPFVSEAVWEHFQPHGPVRVVLDYARTLDPPGPSEVKTIVTYDQTRIVLPHLQLVADETTGRSTIQDEVVRLDEVRGRTAGGVLTVSGTLDFSREVSRYQLAVGLDGVDIAALPGSWQLDRIGITGRLSGSASLRMALEPGGLDLTGSSGAGRIDGAAVRGISLQRLGLALRGEGLRPLAGSAGAPRGVFLPQWIGADFRVRDVELERALARVGVPGVAREVPISGRVSLEASATIPLGTLDDLKAYHARGAVNLAGASIGGLDLGRLGARLDVAEGVLELSEIRGRLVDRPGDRGRPRATDPPPATGPLPPGGFRGRVRAELAADRHIRVDFEGDRLPLGELIAAASARKRPLSGRLTIRGAAEARGDALNDHRAWTLSARAEIPRATYRQTIIRDVRTSLALDHGRLVLPDLSARVGDSPLRGRLGIDLAEPWAYEGELDAGGLPCHDLLALVAPDSDPVHIAGTLAGRGQARGTVRPWRLESSGAARLNGFEIGRIAVGDLPLCWSTQGDTIILAADELQRYGGRIAAEARVPVRGDRPIEGTMRLARVDTAQLSAEAPESWRLTGQADGYARFRLRPWSGDEGPPLEGHAWLAASDLTVRGIPARSVRMMLTIRDGVPKFDIQAESLGGTVLLTGDGHLGSDPKGDEIQAELRANGIQLFELWDALGTSGALAKLGGWGSLTGRLRTHASGDDLRAQGTAELHDLGWGYNYWLGSLRAGLGAGPEGWRIGPLGGELWGGPVQGEGIRVERIAGGRSRYGVDLRLDRIALPRALAFWPEADCRFGGVGMLRVQGWSEGSLRGTAEFRVDRGLVNGLELSELRIPADWDLQPGESGRGQLRIRKAAGKLAGGRVGGDARVALGERRDFRAKLFVDDVDLRVVSREEMGSRPIPGRISGVATLSGPDVSQPAGLRGELDFDLVQASLVDIPLLDELDRSLGSAQGGVFDEGDLHGTVADRRILIDHLTLVGPLAQVHASGTVEFDGRLNLEVVVNTNKGIYEVGQAVLSQAPNVADAVARQSEAIDRVAALLSKRLMTFRITGTIRDPIAYVDRSINVRTAIGFFLKAMRLSLRR